MATHEFTFTDLVHSWSARRRGEAGAEERYALLGDAFGVDLDQPPVRAPLPGWAAAPLHARSRGRFTRGWEAGWPTTLHRLAVEADDALRDLRNPLEGADLGSAATGAVVAQHGAGLACAVTAARQRTAVLLIELLAALYPEAAELTVELELN